MNLNFRQNKGLSLTELMAATIIFSVIMVSVISADFALRRTQQGTSQNSLITTRTAGIMLHIAKNAERAVGSRLEPGIIFVAPDLWIRVEDPLSDPNTYADDPWFCYTYDPGNHNLTFCEVPNSTTSCSDVGAINRIILGTLAGFSANYAPDDTVGSQQFYLEVTLTSRPNPGVGANIFSNPEYVLTQRISPHESSF